MYFWRETIHMLAHYNFELIFFHWRFSTNYFIGIIDIYYCNLGLREYRLRLGYARKYVFRVSRWHVSCSSYFRKLPRDIQEVCLIDSSRRILSSFPRIYPEKWLKRVRRLAAAFSTLFSLFPNFRRVTSSHHPLEFPRLLRFAFDYERLFLTVFTGKSYL